MVKEKLCMQPLEKTCMDKSLFGIGWLNDGLKFSYLKSRKGSILLLQQKSSHNIARTQIYFIFGLASKCMWTVSSLQNKKDLCGQSYKASKIVIYDSRVVPDWKLLHITTLES